MKEIIFSSIEQIDMLMSLLNIKQGAEPELYDLLLKGLMIVNDKEAAISNKNYDKAAELRQKEMNLVLKIFKMLEKRGYIHGNTLTVSFRVKAADEL